MHYSNSLTTNLENNLGASLAREIIAANTHQQLGETTREIRRNLSDPAKASTPDFVIRRYIQARHSGMLAQFPDLPDLIGSGSNIPWSDEAVRALGKELARLSRKQGAQLTAAEWRNYLTGKGARQRSKVFMAAFTLQMSVEDTRRLLLAFGMENYSVRYPLDMICLFCQHIPGTYTWADAEAMLGEFLARRGESSVDAALSAAGTGSSTGVMLADLEGIFSRDLQSANARAALVEYMVQNSGEFVSYKKNQKVHFIPGFSVSRLERYNRLTEYLTVLYPSYRVRSVHKDGEEDNRGWDDNPWTFETRPVRRDDGSISLGALVRAMFSRSLWSDVIWEQPEHENPFERDMREFITNYEKHMLAVERLRKGGSNIAFFERRDALLFIFFLISGYNTLSASRSPADRVRMDQLMELAGGDSELDLVIEEVLDKVEVIFASDDEEEARSRFDSLCECFNMILAELGYPNIYLPAQFDRFVLLALLANDPSEVSTVVMSQSDWDYYYGDTASGEAEA